MIRHTVFGWRAITTWDANGSLIITPNFLLLSHGGVIQQRAFRYFSIQRETKKQARDTHALNRCAQSPRERSNSLSTGAY